MKIRVKLLFVAFLLAFLMPLGVKSNHFVEAQNGGKMPVLIDPAYNIHVNFDERHELLTNNTKYAYLADIWYITYDDTLYAIFSIGDALIYIGFGFWWMTAFLLFVNAVCIASTWFYRKRFQ